MIVTCIVGCGHTIKRKNYQMTASISLHVVGKFERQSLGGKNEGEEVSTFSKVCWQVVVHIVSFSFHDRQRKPVSRLRSRMLRVFLMSLMLKRRRRRSRKRPLLVAGAVARRGRGRNSRRKLW